MAEFKLTYKIGNFDIEFTGQDNEFVDILNRFEKDYLPTLLNYTNKNQEIGKKQKKPTKNKSNKENKENKTIKQNCKKVDLSDYGILEEDVKKWKEFYTKIVTEKNNSFEIITILLYYIKNELKVSDTIKVDKNVVFTFLLETGNKIDFNITDALSNAQRQGRVFIKRTDKNGFIITHNGEELVNKFLNNIG